MSAQPIPANWTVERDAMGRQFYINHTTQTTQWERPAPVDHHSHLGGISPTRSRKIVPEQHLSQNQDPQKTADRACTPRVVFWAAAALALPVWIFSVLVVGEGSWFGDVQFSSVDEDILDQCGDNELRAATNDFCDLYYAFMAMQLISTSLVSLALVLLAMALFFPSGAEHLCFSAKVFGASGGCAVAASALFQLVTIILVVCIKRAESDLEHFFDDTDADFVMGITFWVAVIGYIFAMVDATFLLSFVNSAGDGLFYECIGKLEATKPRVDMN